MGKHMMNYKFDKVIASNNEKRTGLFETTAQRIGTTPQNVEKDFWVSWSLDVLFNGLSDQPRFLFKGGTSLSKGFGLIRRFSEDIDITVFREDLGRATSVEELRNLSGNSQKKTLKKIKIACEEYLKSSFYSEFCSIITETTKRLRLSSEQLRLVVNPEDRQTFNLYYPRAITDETVQYVDRVVKLEFGALSALDPNTECTIQPYIQEDIPNLDFSVANITTVNAERTLWDKIVIIHGLKGWYKNRGVLKYNGHRVSRHYYDLYEMLGVDNGQLALNNHDLGADCVSHARIFFKRPDFNLELAKPPTFSIIPEGKMLDDLRIDYQAMSTMIFGESPNFDAIIERIVELEKDLNAIPQVDIWNY